MADATDATASQEPGAQGNEGGDAPAMKDSRPVKRSKERSVRTAPSPPGSQNFTDFVSSTQKSFKSLEKEIKAGQATHKHTAALLTALTDKLVRMDSRQQHVEQQQMQLQGGPSEVATGPCQAPNPRPGPSRP